MTGTDPQFHPYTYRLFKVFVTCPVTIASCERPFSTLRRLKTWVRNSMGEERPTDLAMMNIHRDIHLGLDVGDIIDRFASKKRKIPFVLYM